MTPRNVAELGQVFTPPQVVDFMLGLCQNTGRTLEPSAGDGAFFNALIAQGSNVTGIELDPSVACNGTLIMDFFDYPLSEQFDSIVGNPPYVRFQDIPLDTRKKLKSPLFDQRSNLFLFFIEKCIRHLKPGGELIFIVPRELIKLTAAKKLNAWLAAQGSITHFYETGDYRVFSGHTPNCAIFRFEKDRFDRQMADGRLFREVAGQFFFLRQDYNLPLSDLFEVRVGAVSGADEIFEHSDGNLAFVCSKTADTGETRRMIYGIRHAHLEAFKDRLIQRRVNNFHEGNWWLWGRAYPLNDRPRIYVNGKTRRAEPFFLHDSPHFDGAILALFPHNPHITRRELLQAAVMLNREVDWHELGFVCDGRYLFTQRSLQNCLLPDCFSRFLAQD